MTNLLKTFIIACLTILICSACDQKDSPNGSDREKNSSTNNGAKFEPPNGSCLLFAGQELQAVGGLEDYNQGYFNYFPHPAGWTMNTRLQSAEKNAVFSAGGLAGIKTTDDWGDGPRNIAMQLSDEDFANSVLSLGVSMVGYERAVAAGDLDYVIDSLGTWLKSLGQRPVFLRIGYEFDGEWNQYDKDTYKKAYRRVKERLDKSDVNNVAYVWQSKGWGSNVADLQSWYPGDDYVDWCGTSFFNRWNEIQMFDFARKKGKPVFIAQATPAISTDDVSITGRTKETRLVKKDQADEAWEQWFKPFFKSIEDNKDVVKAVSYINCNWRSYPMWKDNPAYQNLDSRLHLNPDIAKKWLEETNKDLFIKASPELWETLWK